MTNCGRCAKIRHVIIGDVDLRRNYHRGFNCKFWLLIPHNDRGRSDLLQSCFWQASFRSGEGIVIATAAATANHRLRRWQSIRYRAKEQSA